MTDDRSALEDLVLTRVMRLNASVQGVVTGLLAGIALFVATNWLVIKGGPVVGPHLALLGQFFIGYRVTFVGSLIRTNQKPIGSWDCDPEAGARELYDTINNPYPDDTTAEKYFGIK